MSLRIGITGASGYIGQAVVAHARKAGYTVITIGRRALPDLEHRHVDLAQSPAPDLLDDLDAVLHLAADTSGGTDLANAEIAFAMALARATAQRHIPLLVVSSQAAAVDAPSVYGRTKSAIERGVLPLGAVVLRPGLVYGGSARGLYGLLVGLVRQLPLIPDLYPRPWVQPVHVDDLACALLAALTTRHVSGRLWQVAGPRLPFSHFLSAIARHRLRVRRMRVPVPAWLLRVALGFAGRMLGPRYSGARLDSLIRLPLMATDPDLAELGIRMRPLADGLSPRGRPDRRLLVEGRALMHAFLGASPRAFAARRYAHAMHALADGQALPLAPALLACPLLIAALDTRDFRMAASSGGLAWRYAVAIRLVEAQCTHAARFLPRSGRAGLLHAVADGARAAFDEVLARLLRPLARQFAARLHE